MKLRTLASCLVLLAMPFCLPLRSAAQAAKPTGEKAVSSPVPVKLKGIENAFQLTPKFYSGSAPSSDESFADLKKLGIKTILTVDGSKPDVELAHKYGLHYIHIPIGYDGTTVSNANRIVKAAQVAEGPVFIHCHHGKHRGPAAAALICEGIAGWSTNQALAWLKTAGTAPEYGGLFKTVETFPTPSSETLSKIPAEFPEKIEFSALVDNMVSVDEHWDNLKIIQKAGYRPPADHPDIDPAQEALLLAEGFREALRTEEARTRGDDFITHLKAAETRATSLHAFLKSHNTPDSIDKTEAEKRWKEMTQTCANCHKQYRN